MKAPNRKVSICNMYIYSNISAGLLYVETASPLTVCTIADSQGREVPCEILRSRQERDRYVTVLDASNLEAWSVDHPVLYTATCNGETAQFGHTAIRTFGNSAVLLNEKPIYLRGYIRGIIAHDHPNMTGKSDYEAAKKNISQAKKYGFNLVRFHTTIPSDDFVRAADELGMLIHLEIGFTYEMRTDTDGKRYKHVTSFGENLWEETILRLRNHPSVAMFCIGNEMHRSARFPEVHEMIRQGKALAPTKLILDNCGWGEFDRNTSDLFIQHMGYFLPYTHHADMFTCDELWRYDGSMHKEPMRLISQTEAAETDIYRCAVPVKPGLSHEAMHYIDIPDYAALEKKFDDFCAAVGPEYLETHGIKKPKYFAGLKDLIAQRGIEEIMPEYIKASQGMKKTCMKIFLEKLRLSPLCGHEMLQLSDCLKYENKNGILDFFDDDKYFDPAWMKQINDDLVLVADFRKERLYDDEPICVDVYASDFLPEARVSGTLEVTLDGERIYLGKNFELAGGLQKLVGLNIKPKKITGKTKVSTFAVRFVSGELDIRNSWKLWIYPRAEIKDAPEGVYVTDALDEAVFEKLADGKTVVLNYSYMAERNKWNVLSAIERFKPCIWDRGSNLGGIIQNEDLQAVLGDDRYFDRNMQPLLDLGSKVNLDNWPCKVKTHIIGVDKPVRDRYRVQRDGVKGFVPEDTLRNFSHLFSFKVGQGNLIVSTMNVQNAENPVVSNYLSYIVANADSLKADCGISAEAFKAWLIEENSKEFRPEDTMNKMWTDDKIPVEKVLFWEDLNMNLAAIKA